MKLTFTWKKPKQPYASGEYVLVNGLMMGSYFWGQGEIFDDQRYILNCRLPGIEMNPYKFPSPEAAKAALEQYITTWFKRFE